MKIKKIAVMLIAIALLATDFISVRVPVSAAQAKSVVISEKDINLVVKPGETTHISLPIKAVGSTILLPEVSLTDESGIFTFTDTTLLNSSKVVANMIPDYATTYVEFDVKVKETAQIGSYPVNLNIESSYVDPYNENDRPVTIDFKFNLRILEEKMPTQLTIDKVNYNKLLPGVKSDISFNIINEGEVAARNVYISMDFGDTGLDAGYTTKKIKAGDILPGSNSYITLPIEVLPTASAGLKTIKVDFEFKDLDGNKTEGYSYNFNVNISKNEKAPVIEIEGIDYGVGLKPGDEFVLKANLVNAGESAAQSIAISVDEASLGTDFIKDYYTDNISVLNIAKAGKRTAEIPLMVSRDSLGGPKQIKLKISYTDASGVPYTLTKAIYIDVVGSEPGKSASIIVSKVTQYPARPVAGEQMTVSFDIENRGTMDITELKVKLDNLMPSTFIPVESEPYQYYELLEGGKSLRVTIPLMVSDSISEGLNNLGVKFEYNNGGSDGVTIPILNVQNDLGRSAVPKLIVNDYSTDLEEIKAGSTFNFSYSIENTHSSMAARNIKVTITFEPDSVFSLTQGSNTLYISNIAAGETAINTIELKAKTDAKTGSYPINIQMDYEYEGAKADTEGNVGTQEKANLKLQVIENARPVIDYVNVYSWDGNVMVFAPATLAFEFYNMGKSDLYNVVATVEGDFTKSDGSMYVLGNVMPGGNAYAEFEVIPNIEGMARGVVKITFEDSNGDLVEFSKDFETMVMGEQIWEPMPGEDSGEVFNPGGPMVKKEILPLWLFIVINLVVFLAFIPITRKIIISIYKSKLRKRDMEKY